MLLNYKEDAVCLWERGSSTVPEKQGPELRGLQGQGHMDPVGVVGREEQAWLRVGQEALVQLSRSQAAEHFLQTVFLVVLMPTRDHAVEQCGCPRGCSIVGLACCRRWVSPSISCLWHPCGVPPSPSWDRLPAFLVHLSCAQSSLCGEGE